MSLSDTSLMNIPRSSSTSDLFNISNDFTFQSAPRLNSLKSSNKPMFYSQQNCSLETSVNSLHSSAFFRNESVREKRIKEYNMNAYILQREQMKREFKFPNGERFTPRYKQLNNIKMKNKRMPRSSSLQNMPTNRSPMYKQIGNRSLNDIHARNSDDKSSKGLPRSASSSQINVLGRPKNIIQPSNHNYIHNNNHHKHHRPDPLFNVAEEPEFTKTKRPLKGSVSTPNLALKHSASTSPQISVNNRIHLSKSQNFNVQISPKKQKKSSNIQTISENSFNVKTENKMAENLPGSLSPGEKTSKPKFKFFKFFKNMFKNKNQNNKNLDQNTIPVTKPKDDDVLTVVSEELVNLNNGTSNVPKDSLLENLTFNDELETENFLLNIDLVFDNILLKSDSTDKPNKDPLTSSQEKVHRKHPSEKISNSSPIKNKLPPRSMKRPFLQDKQMIKEYYNPTQLEEDFTERMLNRLTQQWQNVYLDKIDTKLFYSTSVLTIETTTDSNTSSAMTFETESSKVSNSTKKSFRFADDIHISDTWSSEEYNRSDLTFRHNHRQLVNRNRKDFLEEIKYELNVYKSTEMRVHEHSKQYTQFFI